MGLNAKTIYGMPDQWFLIHPTPSLLGMMKYIGREKYALKFCGLFTRHNLLLGGLEEEASNWVESNFPNLFDYAFPQGCGEGIPTPRMTLDCQVPDFKDKNTWETENFERIYPEGRFITPSDLDLTYRDVLRGILLNITYEFIGGEISKKNILAMGIARNCRPIQQR